MVHAGLPPSGQLGESSRGTELLAVLAAALGNWLSWRSQRRH
jgi:hypothetical protein